jgi:hypothetical protein
MDLTKKAPTWLVLALGVPVVVFALHGQSKRNSSGSQSRSAAEREALGVCQSLIKAKATFPSSVDFHSVTGVGTDLKGAGGKPRVSADFDAKNALGNMLPYTGHCDFSIDPPSVTFSNR